MADSAPHQPSQTLPTRSIAKVVAILGSICFLPLFIVALTELRWADEQEVEAIVVSVPLPYQFVCRVPSHPELGSRVVDVGARATRTNVGDSIRLWYSPTHPDRQRYYYLRGQQLSTPVRASLTSGLALILFFVVVAAVRTLRRPDSPSTLAAPRPSI